jgi:hypothetical protein
LRSKFYKDKPKTELPKLIWLKLDWSETCLLQQPSSTWNPIWRSPLINLESYLAIPFIQTKYEAPSGDLQIAKYEIPSGDLL